MPVETPIQTPWLTVAEAAAYSKRHYETVAAALRCGELLGNQPVRDGATVKKGKWLVHRDDLDAWIRGEKADPQPRRVTRGQRAS